MPLRPIPALLIAVALAFPANAQLLRLKPRAAGPPPGTPAAEAEIWPFPAPDPKGWWDDKRPVPGEEADPLGGRRIRSVEQLARPDNGVDPSTYRLWGLMPLQWQLVRGQEMILEVWIRPTDSVRQRVVRVIVRSDDAFVQGRAGLACCEAGIGRRMGFDVRLPAGSAQRFGALRAHPLWTAPRDVRVEEPGAVDTVCLEGVAYDLTLVTAGRSASLRRACDPAEIGQAAEVLQAVLGAALGQDPRFDVLFPRGADFAQARAAYDRLLASGGRLKANPDARLPPLGAEPAPRREMGATPTPTPPPAPEPPPARP